MDSKVKEELKTSVDMSDDVASEDGIVQEEMGTQENAKKKHSSGVSRRGLLGGAAAAVIVGAGGAMAVPLLSNAETGDSSAATKQDIAKLEYELSQLTKSSDDAELVSHKVTKIDETCTDVQYPSAKAAFNALEGKVKVDQGKEYAGYIFKVNEEGNVIVSKFCDDELSEVSLNPVENRVIFKALQDIKRLLKELDLVPTKDSKHGVESGGVYKTYQETTEKKDLNDLKMGVNYKYTGKLIGGVTSAGDEDPSFSVRKIDTTLMAINQTDPSMVFTSADNGGTWGAPYGGW